MSDTTLGMVECSCKKTKVAPGHFCPHCLWVNTDPETTPLQNPPPDAERVSMEKLAKELALTILTRVSKTLTAHGLRVDVSAMSLDELILSYFQQLRARPALDLEKVMDLIDRLEMNTYHVGLYPISGKIRDILETALGEKE